MPDPKHLTDSDATPSFTKLDIINQHELRENDGHKFFCSCGRWTDADYFYRYLGATTLAEAIKSSWLAHIQRERDALRSEQTKEGAY